MQMVDEIINNERKKGMIPIVAENVLSDFDTFQFT